MADNHNSFKGAEWYGKNVPVLVGGAGGLGSWVTLMLCRMGITKIGIYDHDIIETRNLGGQFFKSTQVNQPKVQALKQNCIDFADVEILTYQQRYDENSMRADFMFACFDNMAARELMFKKWKLGQNRQLLVDIRLGFEQLDILFVTKETEEEYEIAHLFDDSDVADLPCAEKQTTHIACLAASMAIAGFTNYLSDVRDPAFHQTYISPLNYYKGVL